MHNDNSFFCNLDIGFEINLIKAIISRGRWHFSHLFAIIQWKIHIIAATQLVQGPVALQKNKLTMDGRLPVARKKGVYCHFTRSSIIVYEGSYLEAHMVEIMLKRTFNYNNWGKLKSINLLSFHKAERARSQTRLSRWPTHSDFKNLAW